MNFKNLYFENMKACQDIVKGNTHLVRLLYSNNYSLCIMVLKLVDYKSVEDHEDVLLLSDYDVEM